MESSTLSERENRINTALRELEAVRREEFPVEFIKQVNLEFDDLGWSTEKCVRKISDCKYRDIIGRIKFSDFVDERSLIPYKLVESLAMEYLNKRGVVPLERYNKLSKDYNTLRTEPRPETPRFQEKDFKLTIIDLTVDEVREIFYTYLLQAYMELHGSGSVESIKIMEKVFERAKCNIDVAIDNLKNAKLYAKI